MLIGPRENFNKFGIFLDRDFIGFIDLYDYLAGGWAGVYEVEGVGGLAGLVEGLPLGVEVKGETGVNFLHGVFGEYLEYLYALHKLPESLHMSIQVLRDKGRILMMR